MVLGTRGLVGAQGTPATATAGTSTAALAIVPKPRQITLDGSRLQLPARPTIAATPGADHYAVDALVAFLRTRGLQPATRSDAKAPADITIRSAAHIAMIGREGYRLDVTPAGITITANTGAGAFYAVQTLEQMLPVSRASGNSVPGGTIVDWPAYPWRGIHLDVARHFFSARVVEQYIDVSAHYKINTFHWHLTDDQGWRFPVARYPKLTTVGACRAGSEIGNDPEQIDHHRYCGAYTAADIRAVVAYAKARYVTIVPEIEMPGHSVAALTAYPWLACTKGPFALREIWGISTDILCPTERTFTFVENVLAQVHALFPGPYVHIGGDEVPTDAWQHSAYVHALMAREHLASYPAVQSYFTRRIERYLEAHGRRMVGWDEILDGGVSTHATVMSWRGTDGGIVAARRGNDVVMSPSGPVYLDWAQGDTAYEPVAIDGLSTPQMIYDFNPTPPVLTAAQASHILGIQGNLWTERIATTGHLFYMLLPRELAVAEDGWTPASDRVWSDFAQRCRAQYTWLENMRINFRIPDPTIALQNTTTVEPESVTRSSNETELRVHDPQATLTISDDVPDAAVYYTTDDSLPTLKSTPYLAPLTFDLTKIAVLHVRAIAVLPSGRASAPTTLTLRR
jgi:hexosaminidase